MITKKIYNGVEIDSRKGFIALKRNYELFAKDCGLSFKEYVRFNYNSYLNTMKIICVEPKSFEFWISNFA